MRRRQWQGLSAAVILLLGAAPAAAQPWAGIIAPARAIDWASPRGAQGGIQPRPTICATLNPGATVSQINSAISSCPSGQTVFLNAGTYNISGMINFGSKSNVTLRGAGADRTIINVSGSGDCTGLGASVCVTSGGVNSDSPQNSTSWTAGYAPGTTTITVGSASNLQPGRIIILDQLNDSSDGGGIFVCSTSSCSDEGGNAPGRNNRGQMHLAKVTAVSGNQVSIHPPLTMPNWRASQSPGLWWNAGGPIVSGAGIEDLTIDATNARSRGGIVFVHVSDSWVKGVRIINADRSHVWLYKSLRMTVRDSYFYGGQGDHSESYGVEGYATGWNLIENNIFQHVTGPIKHNGSETGSVIAYNFSIDDNYTAGGSAPGWMIPTIGFHEVGISYLLHEGNDGLGVLHDDIHGTIHLNTVFRNHFYGDVWNNPPKNSNTAVVNIASYGRFFNIIGNVLGRTGYYNSYQANLTESSRAIYALGWSPENAVPSDPRTAATLFRWGNYDTVNNTVRFVAAEVPTSDSFFPNPVPGSQQLPASFYLSGRPSFWTTPWGTPPWPAIGPDVSNGNVAGWGGHANRIPARLCYENTPKSNGILVFNASSCYSSTTAPVPVPTAPANVRIIR
jgi:hypothetical protein